MASLLPYFLTKIYTIFTTINIMPKLHIFESINFQAKWQAYSLTFDQNLHYFHHHQYHAKTAHFRIN